MSIWETATSLIVCFLTAAQLASAAETAARVERSKWSAKEIKALERSFWLHASLGASIVKGYWAKDAPVGPLPTEDQIRCASKLLVEHYGANRLYLVYHNEATPAEFGSLLRLWRRASPGSVELVPTLVLRRYDKDQGQVFSTQEVGEVCAIVRRELKPGAVAVYDVLPNRDQGQALDVLAREFAGKLIRVGIQPEEEIRSPFVGAVQDTWSGLCHGKTNEDWLSPGFGADMLHKWVRARNSQTRPIAWDLVAVAWDYSTTQRGEYPGYDDALKNMPLPAERNRLAAREVLAAAESKVLAGFSSDFVILDANSRSPNRDGPSRSIYECLKRGETYRGCFGKPLEEIAAIYRDLRSGKAL